MKFKIDRVKPIALTNQISKMTLMGSEIYFVLDTVNDKFDSSVYLPTKDVVKCSEVSLKTIFESIDILEKPLKLGFFDGNKVKNVLTYFDLAALSAEISYFDDGEYFIAENLVLSDNTLKIVLSCLDPVNGFTMMTKDQTSVAFSEDSKVYSFTLNSMDLSKIAKLNTLDATKLFSIYTDPNGVHVKGDNYDIVVDDSIKVSNPEVLIFKTFLPRIDQESYDVKVCQGAHNKIILDSKDTDTKVALNLALRPE